MTESLKQPFGPFSLCFAIVHYNPSVHQCAILSSAKKYSLSRIVYTDTIHLVDKGTTLDLGKQP